ncbi:MAG: hypothetical protein HY549_08850, partial [Elusimicrobia bacterium]|nr:hypothetical protein [Elusimicrobiota bacterium]
KIIESEIQQANGIINEILTYSRTRELNPERISLNSFIEELLSSHPFPAHITIEKLLDPSNPVVDVDVTEMKQAIRNLIGNAVEVMTSSGRLRVRTGMGEAGTAFIEIADTGPGIPPDVLEKIFTPFFTTKARGTGLGLAVVRKVADRHRGRVDVESVIGKGTTFRLFLPIVQKVKV